MNIRGFRISSGGLPALLVTTALLAGCAASVAAARPADFPLHSEAPPVDFYWRLSVAPDAVQADGLVERRNHLIAERLAPAAGPRRDRPHRELHDPDAGPLEVRVGRGVVHDPAPASRGEQRYEVRLYSFEYPEENTP